MNHDLILFTTVLLSFKISTFLGLFLLIVVFPLTGKNKSRKTRLCMLPVLILLFIGILALYPHMSDLVKDVDLSPYTQYVLFGFGILALAFSLISKKKRTKGSILVSTIIILLPCLVFAILWGYLWFVGKII